VFLKTVFAFDLYSFVVKNLVVFVIVDAVVQGHKGSAVITSR
jgi:hypothetical protein